jgi:hypothetical protein
MKNLVLKSTKKNEKYGFELYISPPRSVLAADSDQTLIELRLAPAAIINLTWTIDLLISTEASSITNEDHSSSDSNIMKKLPLGYYLSDQLLRIADDKNGEADVTFPKGLDLVPKKKVLDHADEESTNKSQSVSKLGLIEDTDSTADSKNVKKKLFKWIKTG